MRCLRERGGGERSPPGGWEERDNKAGDGDRCGGGGVSPGEIAFPVPPNSPPRGCRRGDGGGREGEAQGWGKVMHGDTGKLRHGGGGN